MVTPAAVVTLAVAFDCSDPFDRLRTLRMIFSCPAVRVAFARAERHPSMRKFMTAALSGVRNGGVGNGNRVSNRVHGAPEMGLYPSRRIAVLWRKRQKTFERLGLSLRQRRRRCQEPRYYPSKPF